MAKKRTPKANDIQRWLGSTTIPLFVLDIERRICLFNLGCQELTGWAAGDVVGQMCQYAGQADVQSLDALTGSLCPPPEAFSGQTVSIPAHLVHKDGRSASHRLQFFPLWDDAGAQIGVLGVVSQFLPMPPGGTSSPVHQLHAELSALRIAMRTRFGTSSLTCRSDCMRRVLSQVELAQNCTAPVSVEGEPGSGREHVARVIHYGSATKSRWFVPLNCATTPSVELTDTIDRLYEESYHERSHSQMPQLGTLYLADVDCLPRDVQQLLLQLASPAENPPRPLPRLIASTSLPLREAVSTERLRPDLFSHLSTIAIEVPPLRERDADLRLLAQQFIEDLNRLGSKQVTGVSDDAWKLLEEYRWPGNIDELQVVIREAHLRCSDHLIRTMDLPFRFHTRLESQQLALPTDVRSLPLDELLENVERQLITLALERCRFNKTKAAELLRINRVRLYSRMQRLGIEDRESSAGTSRSDDSKPAMEAAKPNRQPPATEFDPEILLGDNP